VVEGALVLVLRALLGQAHHLAGAGMEGRGCVEAVRVRRRRRRE
jgi:hypothetical protein